MLKDRIIEIVKSLTLYTDKHIMIWKEEDPNHPNRSFKRKMFSEGEDGTKYEIEIKYLLKNDNWVIDDEASLWIRNNKLPDTMMLVSSFRSDGETLKLRNSILTNFCKDMSPSISDVEDTLLEIAKGISLSEFRSGRLSNLLGDK